MKTKSARKPAPEQPAPLASYVAEFEQWMRTSARCGKGKAEDICQELRLALWEIRDLPVTRDEARCIFLRLASSIECRARREAYRQGALVHDAEEFAEHVGWFNEQAEREIVRTVALFNALEKLTDHERWLVKECKIDGRTYADVAKQVDVTEAAITSRLWRAMARLIAIFEDDRGDGSSEKQGAIIAPLAFEFTDIQRAAFSAIWRAEGRVPTFGGGPSEPPSPPPIVPGVPPIAVAPVVSAAVGTAVSAVTIAIVLALLVLVPTSIVAIYYFWDPPHAQTANKGLRVPSVIVVDDVVPLYPLPFPTEQTPTTSTSGRAKTPAPSSNTPSSSPPIDPEEMERARRQAPRSLPARKK